MTTETLPAEIPELYASIRRIVSTALVGTLVTVIAWAMLQ